MYPKKYPVQRQDVNAQVDFRLTAVLATVACDDDASSKNNANNANNVNNTNNVVNPALVRVDGIPGIATVEVLPELADPVHDREFRAAWVATVWGINFPSSTSSVSAQQAELVDILEVVACELGVQERELVFGHAGRCQRGRAAGQAEVIEDFGDDSGVGEEGEHTQKGGRPTGAFWADEGVDVERTFELMGPGVAVALRRLRQRWRWGWCTFGLRSFGHRPRPR